MSEALDRVGFTVDWSNPLAGALDAVIREAIKELGLDEYLEKVSGDNETLTRVAGHWRHAARDMRGVVDDLMAERKALQASWTGDASTAFGSTMTEFEKAMLGEADDMDTVAELLEAAAEACFIAEEAMVELIVEIVETLLVAAATAAIVALLTAGVGAAIGPLIAAAGAANRAMKAVRITAKLADKLSDLARRMQALRKLRKGRDKLKDVWSDTGKRKKLSRLLKHGVVKPALGANLVDAGIGAAPTAASVAEHYGVDTDRARETVETVKGKANELGDRAERAVHDTTGLDYVQVGDQRYDLENQQPRETPAAPRPPKEAAEYADRPDPKSFDERLAESTPVAGRSVREAFG